MTDGSADVKWCNLGKHHVPLDGFAKNQHTCRSCRKTHYAAGNYSLGKRCRDCGVPVVNHARFMCRRCRGISLRGTPSGAGKSMSVHGYVILSGQYDHPNADRRGLLREHAKVMSEMLGRPLVPGENVHHINGIRHDNRPENLELWTSSQPPGQRVADLVSWAREILERYGEEFPE